MARARLFYTGSTRIISDASITATEHRVYACVSLHDGMSLLKGKGAGCYASNQTLAAEVGCDYSTLCKALSRLVSAGYLVKGVSGDDRRMTVYRVTFPAEDRWRARHPDTDEIGGEPASAADEIGGEGSLEIGAIQPETAEHYIPLKVELDSVETEEINSAEAARLAARRLSKIDFVDNAGAQMAQFEREWKETAESVSNDTLIAWHDWLAVMAECQPDCLGAPDIGRARRLLEDVDMALWERKAGHHASSGMTANG